MTKKKVTAKVLSQKKIGPDIVLVDTKPNDCRVPRKKLLG